MRALGFPDFFRIQLAVMKTAAVIVLVAPCVPAYMKEWAYAGIGFFIVTAIVAHTAHQDPVALTLINIVFLSFLAVSYRYWRLMVASG